MTKRSTDAEVQLPAAVCQALDDSTLLLYPQQRCHPFYWVLNIHPEYRVIVRSSIADGATGRHAQIRHTYSNHRLGAVILAACTGGGADTPASSPQTVGSRAGPVRSREEHPAILHPGVVLLVCR